jgi:predicted DCC family thiol-disulfide oxidoreductase YuxK
MAAPAPQKHESCVLVYDAQCRMCVTAKTGLERLESEQADKQVRMIPYQSEEARSLLGDAYQPGRPDAAFLIGPEGEVARGLDAFLPLLPGLKGGRLMASLFRVPLVKPIAYLLYRIIARYRYRLFGEVPLEGLPVHRKGTGSQASPQ